MRIKEKHSDFAHRYGYYGSYFRIFDKWSILEQFNRSDENYQDIYSSTMEFPS